MQIRAVATSCLPFFTIKKMPTVSYERVAVVKSPYARNSMFVDVMEQHRKIQIISMKCMHMNNIRLRAFDIGNQSSRCDSVPPPIQPNKPAKKSRRIYLRKSVKLIYIGII